MFEYSVRLVLKVPEENESAKFKKKVGQPKKVAECS